jgi:hypothetical protein
LRAFKAEYLFIELGSLTAQMGPAVALGFTNNPAFQANFGDGRYHIFRVGLNYQFH